MVSCPVIVVMMFDSSNIPVTVHASQTRLSSIITTIKGLERGGAIGLGMDWGLVEVRRGITDMGNRGDGANKG
jgi:hypothetical protein